jgi:hypothetical protein
MGLQIHAERVKFSPHDCRISPERLEIPGSFRRRSRDAGEQQHSSQVVPSPLILIDVINHFEFTDGDKILKNALPMAGVLAKLKAAVPARGHSRHLCQ